MVEIQLPHLPFCDMERGCAPLQVLSQRVEGIDEQVQRHEAVHKEIFQRLNTVSTMALTILLTLLGAFISLSAGLIYLILKH